MWKNWPKPFNPSITFFCINIWTEDLCKFVFVLKITRPLLPRGRRLSPRKVYESNQGENGGKFSSPAICLSCLQKACNILFSQYNYQGASGKWIYSKTWSLTILSLTSLTHSPNLKMAKKLCSPKKIFQCVRIDLVKLSFSCRGGMWCFSSSRSSSGSCSCSSTSQYPFYLFLPILFCPKWRDPNQLHLISRGKFEWFSGIGPLFNRIAAERLQKSWYPTKSDQVLNSRPRSLEA